MVIFNSLLLLYFLKCLFPLISSRTMALLECLFTQCSYKCGRGGKYSKLSLGSVYNEVKHLMFLRFFFLQMKLCKGCKYGWKRSVWVWFGLVTPWTVMDLNSLVLPNQITKIFQSFWVDCLGINNQNTSASFEWKF